MCTFDITVCALYAEKPSERLIFLQSGAMAEQVDKRTDQVHGAVWPGTDRKIDAMLCEPCKIDNNNQPAVGWCETCDELLCNDCYTHHCRPTMMRNHQLWSLEEMKKRKQMKRVTNKCKKHEQEAFKYFCEDHKELGCNQCFVSKHRQCSKVVCISEVTTADSDESKALELLLTELERKLKTIEEKTERNESVIGRQHDEVIAGIKEAGEKLKKRIDTLVKEQIAKAEQTKDDNVRKIGEVREMNGDSANTLSTVRDMLASERGDNNQLFITMKHVQAEANVLKSRLDEAEQKHDVKMYAFVLNSELTHLLETMTELGSLKDTRELEMDKATDEIVDELEVTRFLIQRPHERSSGLWNYSSGEQDAIQVSTNRDIRLLYVLLYRCHKGDTIVDLSISERRNNLFKCASTHAEAAEDIVAVKVVGEGGVHGVTLKAGQQYDVVALIKGTNSCWGEEGFPEITVKGVKFTFSTTDSQNGTNVSGGQIPGFKFVPL